MMPATCERSFDVSNGGASNAFERSNANEAGQSLQPLRHNRKYTA